MYYKKITCFFALFLLFLCFTTQAQKTAVVGFYNVENLYDTVKDSIADDSEFLPTGAYQWTMERYLDKLKKLSFAISQIGKEQGGVVVLGVCEVENEGVLNDLVAQAALKPLKYKVAHHNSPDARGVDVAFIYQSERFEFISLQDFELKIPENPRFRTRDQLLMVGVLDNTDTLYLIANHWPSKRGGEARSNPLRMAAAKLTRSIVDSLLNVHPHAKIIIKLVVHSNISPSNNNTNHLATRSLPTIRSTNIPHNSMHNLAGRINHGGDIHVTRYVSSVG